MLAPRAPKIFLERPIISVKEVQALIGAPDPATNEIMARLTQEGILREITGRAGSRRFRYDRYVNLFGEVDSGG